MADGGKPLEGEEEGGDVGGAAKVVADKIIALGTIGGWKITKTIGAGANGVVVLADRGEEKGVLKVAIGEGEGALRWEIAILNRIKKKADKDAADTTAHVVRMIDSGLFTFDGKEMAYMVMESLPGSPISKLGGISGHELIKVVCEYGLQLLKALYDLHSLSLLHRDIKCENMGMYEDSLTVMYDLGMARVITEGEGAYMRTPRYNPGIRGTDEWASLNCEQGRDQGRVDDLWGWLYVMVEMVNCKSSIPQAWAGFDKYSYMRPLMKSNMFAARLVLSNCPVHFHRIAMYLHILGRDDTPDYFWLATQLQEARKEVKAVRPANLNHSAFRSDLAFLERQY